jgi:hypothetical protein
MTFVAMKLAGVSLQRISLGALIIGLGLLVDDAMIAVEMMIKKLEEGYDKVTCRNICLYLYRLSDADGNAGHHRGLRPRGLRSKQRRRIYLHVVRRRGHRVGCFLVRGRAVYAADRRFHSARQDEKARP